MDAAPAAAAAAAPTTLEGEPEVTGQEPSQSLTDLTTSLMNRWPNGQHFAIDVKASLEVFITHRICGTLRDDRKNEDVDYTGVPEHLLDKYFVVSCDGNEWLINEDLFRQALEALAQDYKTAPVAKDSRISKLFSAAAEAYAKDRFSGKHSTWHRAASTPPRTHRDPL